MNKKMQNLEEIDYYSNFNLVGEVLLKLKKQNKNSKSIEDAVEAMTQIGFYVNTLIRKEKLYDRSLQSYQSDKLRAIQRARRVETELEKINKKYKI
tara:strand:- start:1990 stop:2277 length:288 start_codon:yes stop_codon:yes gene_type:complete